MKRLIIISSLLLAACSPDPTPVDDGKLEDALAKLEQAEAELKRAKENAAKAASGAASKAVAKVDEVEGDIEADEDGPSLCWQDYCPCEPGQDGQGAEASLCRNLKAGIHVDDKIMASAAMMRDARRQMREFENDNPGF